MKKNRLFMVITLTILSMFGTAFAQGVSGSITKELSIIKDATEVSLSANDIFGNPSLAKKQMQEIISITGEGTPTLLIKKKNAIRPQLRIETSSGVLMFSETQDYRNVRFYITNLPKDQETNTVTVYDEFKKQIISENTFTLKPVIRHRYNVQIQYTDTSGTLQTYQPPGNPIRDIDITKEGKIIITDEYGNIRKVKSHVTSSPYIVINNPFYSNSHQPFIQGDIINNQEWFPGKGSSEVAIICRFEGIDGKEETTSIIVQRE